MIKGQTELQKAYQDDRVAEQYVAQRFETPLGAMLHARQVQVIRQLIRDHAIREAVEIAPGPARVTVDIAPLLDRVTIIDASSQMLNEARRRLAVRGVADRVYSVRADAFRMPVQAAYSLVYTFRLIRHFPREDRVRLYRQITSILKPGGWLVFDAVNELVSAPLQAGASAGEYEHFDALLRPETIREELRESGFDVEAMIGAHRSYGVLRKIQIYVAPRSAWLAKAAMVVADRFGSEPLEWVVVCRRL